MVDFMFTEISEKLRKKPTYVWLEAGEEYNYEKLVKNPNKEIPKIINWLGWEWDEAYLAPHKNKRNVFTASSSQVRKKIYASSIRVWEEYEKLLTPAIEIVKSNELLKNRI